MRACALIPAYNESARIGDVVEGARGQGVTVVVVDDGSTDGTEEAARRGGATVLRHPRNRGKGEALKTGFRYAIEQGVDAVITLDGDGQHDPAEIPEIVARAEQEGSDIVLGCRMGDVSRMPLLRIWTNQITSAVLSRLAHTRISDSQSGYRLIRTRALRSLDLVTRKYDLESEILVRAARRGFRISEVPVRTIYEGSESKIHPGLDTLRFIRLALRLILTRPRR